MNSIFKLKLAFNDLQLIIYILHYYIIIFLEDSNDNHCRRFFKNKLIGKIII